ncbi:MAG: PspA/IM30 family protein [Candidatus Obscuribacterales bacterium]|nr:PspA/IM30 family protein [Candidatus Obscuribacterales bacterium]
MIQSTEEKHLESLLASLEAASLKTSIILIRLRRTMAQAQELESELLPALDKSKAAVARWHERATLAVTQGNDDLAKQALEQKLRSQKQLEIFSSIAADNKSFIDAMQENLDQVEATKQGLHQRRHILTLRAKYAAAAAQLHRRLAAHHRQQALSEIDLQIHELQGQADEKLLPFSQILIDNLSQIFDDIDLEISAMEAPASSWNKNSKTHEKRRQDADALQREFNEMKKARKDAPHHT